MFSRTHRHMKRASPNPYKRHRIPAPNASSIRAIINIEIHDGHDRGFLRELCEADCVEVWFSSNEGRRGPLGREREEKEVGGACFVCVDGGGDLSTFFGGEEEDSKSNVGSGRATLEDEVVRGGLWIGGNVCCLSRRRSGSDGISTSN